MSHSVRCQVSRAAVALVAGALVPLASVPAVAASPPERPFPDVISLPDGFAPEGIAIGPGPTAWFGSLVDGDIYSFDLRTGTGETVSEGPGTPSAGMKTDRAGRLFVAGGDAGDARVVDTATGEVLETYSLADDAAFVNDVVVTRTAAYFTDSFQPRLFRLPFGPGGVLPDPSQVETLPLGGEWEQGSGFGANGITTTPAGRALLVVNTTTGLLYRVDPTTGEATEVDLGGDTLTNGDGLLRSGRTLYAVLNQQNRVAVVRLGAQARSGRVTGHLTHPEFDIPTTAARFGRWLYLPNARFSTPPTPDTTYTAVRVPARP